MRKKPSLSPSGGFFVETSDALSFAGILSPLCRVVDSMRSGGRGDRYREVV